MNGNWWYGTQRKAPRLINTKAYSRYQAFQTTIEVARDFRKCDFDLALTKNEMP